MVALKASDIDAFVAKPDSRRPIALVYGPDAGLVAERVEALVKSAVDDPRDPFALTRLDGDDLAGTPELLVEAANTIPLFGGKRAILVRVGSKNVVPALERLIASPGEARVVLHAGDLKRNAPLRALCEKSALAVALPCYADSDRDIARLIDDEIRAANLTITADAKSLLVALLGGDRAGSRAELRKLALYAMGQERIDVQDIQAIVADASALAIDGIIDSALAGRLNEFEAEFAKARIAATAPGTILAAAQRQVAQMHKMRIAIEAGTPITRAVESFEPPLHFRRKSLVEAALKTWTATRLLATMAKLADATLESRRYADLGETIAHRALLSAAMESRRRT